MNIPRLVYLSELVKNELKTTGAVGRFDRLVKQVQEAINGPNEATQRAVEESRKEFATLLNNAASNRLSPALRADLADIKGGDGVSATGLLGDGLQARLDQAFDRGFLNVQVLDQLRAISAQLQQLNTANESLLVGLNGIGAEKEVLTPGDSIVGMTIPRTEITNGLAELRKEMKFFDELIVALGEVVNGDVGEPTVVSLRSSAYGIDVSATIEVTSMISLIVQGIRQALELLAKHRELKRDAEALGIQKKVLEELNKTGIDRMKTAVDEIEAEVFNHCVLDDAGRVNELRTSIKLKINGVVNRMERGFTFEARTALPDGADEKKAQHAEKIAALSRVEFRPLPGPRMIELPEETESADADESKKLGTKKR